MVVEYVQPSPRKWENPKGEDLFFVGVNFADGSEGSVGVVQGKVDEARSSLEAVKGSAVEFELAPGKEYNGVTQWRIRSWPGKPSGLGGAGGGGGRGGGGMSHPQVGYLAAASVLGPIIAQEMAGGTSMPDALVASRVVQMGEAITEALFTRQPKAESQTETKSETPKAEHVPAQAAGDTITLPQLKQLKETLISSGLSVEEACVSLGIKNLTELTREQAEEAIALFAG
jgi:hypothetical protein